MIFRLSASSVFLFFCTINIKSFSEETCQQYYKFSIHPTFGILAVCYAQFNLFVDIRQSGEGWIITEGWVYRSLHVVSGTGNLAELVMLSRE